MPRFLLSFLAVILCCLTLFSNTAADITQLQLIGTFAKIPVPPFSATCPDAIRVLQVDPLSTNEGIFFVISHNQIQLPLLGGGVQTCTSEPVTAPRFSDLSATVLRRQDQSFLDSTNPLVNAFAVADEVFFLGQELGPRTCGQSILPANTVSMWVAPDSVITVAAGDYAINFKPGFKYVYYFSETDPCLYRGSAVQEGTVRPVPTPPSPTPVSQLLSPLPIPSLSPFPSASPASNAFPAAPDDGVTILDGVAVESSQPACFPYDATVQTKRGVVDMGELKVGEDVLVGKGIYSQVFGFTHATCAVWVDFVTLSTSTRRLTLSQGHYVYANGAAIQAKDVSVGDFLRDVEHGFTAVTGVEMVTKKGLYNPQTVDGNIVVDGVIVTTYTTALGKVMTAHALLTPMRVFRRLFSVDGWLEWIRLWWLAVYQHCRL